MYAYAMGLTIALMAQVADERYLGADAAAAAAPAEPDPTGGVASQITLAPETPAPTLVEGAAPADAGGVAAGSAAPDPPLANPFAGSQPSDAPASVGASDVGTPADAGAADVSPENSVLANSPKPADVMRTLLTPPTTGQLPGVALTLGEAIRGAANRHAQTELAQAYWNLAATVAQYYLAIHEQADLNTLRQGVATPAPAWTAASDEATKRVAVTRELATAAQLHLHRLMGASANTSLPLPADPPHCGRYNTRYDEIFTAGNNPAARQLNDLLPLHFATLVSQSKLIAEAGEWLLFVSENRDTANDGMGLLRAYELLALQRRTFIDSVAEYNLHIASYAELAAPDEVRPERLVSMLIRVSNPAASAREDAAVQPASAEEPAVATSGALRTRAPGRVTVGRGRSPGGRSTGFAIGSASIVSSRQLLRRGARDRD